MFYSRRHNGGITPDLRYESVGRGFESLPSHQNPTKNRKILRGFFVFQGACTFLHIRCTSAGWAVYSVHPLHGVICAAQKENF